MERKREPQWVRTLGVSAPPKVVVSGKQCTDSIPAGLQDT